MKIFFAPVPVDTKLWPKTQNTLTNSFAMSC